jgi:hypothetical protein
MSFQDSPHPRLAQAAILERIAAPSDGQGEKLMIVL